MGKRKRKKMLTSQRKQQILEVLQREGQVIAKEISESLGVSQDTIRRDLRELAQEGLLQRVHGGALPASLAVANFAQREVIAVDAKQAIGRAAAQMIKDGQVVFLDGGTTTAQLVRHLSPTLHATVVTHSATIAAALATHPTVEVVVIGGRLFKHSIVSVGAAAIAAIAQIHADIYFMGVTGVHPSVGLTTADYEEAQVKRVLCQSAAETIVLASHEKLGAASPYVITALREISGLIVESAVSEAQLAPYRQLGITIIQAQ
jgi:DeoR/GlpR family transcriptional regulator of sugar metabolism